VNACSGCEKDHTMENRYGLRGSVASEATSLTQRCGL
jgi:hypothetical protein